MTISPSPRQPWRFPFPVRRPGEPADEFRLLREQCPVARVRFPTGDEAWLVTTYQDNRTVLTDDRFSRAATTRPGAPRLQPIPPEPASMLQMDPPEHTRLRRLVSGGFAVRRIERLRPAVRAHVEALLEAMSAAPRPFDLVDGVARRLPLTVICDLLGVPEQDRARLFAWVEVLLSLTSYPPERVRRARAEMKDYLARLIESKRAHPGEDLLTYLVARHDEGGSLNEEELVMMAATIITGGFLSTANEITLSVLCLLRHPDQLARLREDPALLPEAVEELLRYNALTTGGGLLRVAVADVELGGTLIKAGEAVLPALSSANRDPSVFPDPDRFVIDRKPNPHLAFGLGAHFCLGAHLARIELEETLGGLLRRFPSLRLAVPEESLRPRQGHLMRGLETLPVTW